MKIACLQNAAVIGEIPQNIARAEKLLTGSGIRPGDLDLLVLPELALTGYNFPDLEAITPFLEPTSAGVSTRWARDTARRLRCAVHIGYPEVATEPPLEKPKHQAAEDEAAANTLHMVGTPVVPKTDPAFPHNYNATVLVDDSGEVRAHYRKSHLYYTDATWAREGNGFYAGQPFKGSDGADETQTAESIRRMFPLHDSSIAMGICMDLNAHNFTAPRTTYEFATHVVSSKVDLVLVSMAWLSSDLVPIDVQGSEALRPDLEVVVYWMERLSPMVKAEKTTVVVLANRVGVEGKACYVGTSTVIRLGGGKAEVWEMLGKGIEEVLVVDTDEPPKYILKERSAVEGADDADDD